MEFLEKHFKIRSVDSENTSDILLMSRQRFLETIAESLSKLGNGEKRLAYLETIRSHVEGEISLLNGIYSFLGIIFVTAGFLLQSVSMSSANVSDSFETEMKILEIKEKQLMGSGVYDQEQLGREFDEIKSKLLKAKQEENDSIRQMIKYFELVLGGVFISLLIAYFSQILPLMFHRQALRTSMLAVIDLEYELTP